jgi:hypothetical protein
MFFILVVICSILIYFIISYWFLLQLENKINSIQNILFQYSDKRFSIFEILLNKSLNFLQYEQTFLKEIVQLRSQAKKFKQDGNLKAAFLCEERISQLAKKINILFSEFPILNRIEDSVKIQNEIISMENSMLEMKNQYNQVILNYNNIRKSVLFMPIFYVTDRFNEDVEDWKIIA